MSNYSLYPWSPADWADPEALDRYIDGVLGPYTHRRRSEHDGLPVDALGVRFVVRGMAARLRAMFGDGDNIELDGAFFAGDIVSRYVQDACRVHPSHPLAIWSRLTPSLLTVDKSRAASEIKQNIRARYPPHSIPAQYVSLLDALESCQEGPTHKVAAGLFRSLSASVPYMALRVGLLAEIDTMSLVEASTKSFNEQVSWITENGEPSMASVNSQGALVISPKEAEGLIQLSHLQDKPYMVEELTLAGRLLRDNRRLTCSMMVFQLMLVNHLSERLRTRPELLRQTLQTYNPIALPTTLHSSSDLVPNPKLLQVMSNNWVPAIARSMLGRYPDLAGSMINPAQLLSEDIETGILAAPSYAIFGSTIGRFTRGDTPGPVAWHGSFNSACPARKTFTILGAELIGRIYRDLHC